MGAQSPRVAVDALGSDHGLAVVVAGALGARRRHAVAVSLVGPERALRQELARAGATGAAVEVLAAAEGHPPSVMDMSFANQALSSADLAKNGDKLEKQVYGVPEHIDREVAALKRGAMAIEIDELLPEQKKYLSSWDMGT